MTSTAYPKSGYSLLDDAVLFDRIAQRIAADHGMSRAEAGTALDQAIVFVATTGNLEGAGLSCPASVDPAWDTFITFTKQYTAFCMRVCGRYVHHEPVDPGQEPITKPGGRVLTIAESAHAIREAGYEVNEALWPADALVACMTLCYDPDHRKDDAQTPQQT